MSSVLDERATFAVVLTGGIASGKSAVARRFEKLHVPVFDADVVAHSLVQRGQESLDEISAVFGRSFLDASGELDRRQMRELVFEDRQAREKLEKILHPKIRNALIDDVQRCGAPFCVLAIPLFAEHRTDYTWIDRVLVTDVTRQTQIDRLVQRPGIDESLAGRIIDAQASREQRLSLASDVVDNTAPIDRLASVVSRLLKLYSRLASEKSANRSKT